MSGSGQGNPAPGSGMNNPAGTAGADPSMEDILASIRRILSEDEVPAAAKLVALPPEDDVLALDESMLVQEPPAPQALIQQPITLPPVAAQPPMAEPGFGQPTPAASSLAALGSFMSISALQNPEPPQPVAEPALFQPPPVAVAAPQDLGIDRPVFLQGSIDALSTSFSQAPAIPEPLAFEPVLPLPQQVAAAVVEPPAAVVPPPQRSVETLVAPEAAAAASASMSSLVRTLTAERHSTVYRGGPTLEDMVRDEMRPMLKDWLDNNLPAMVERIVRSEIERVAGRVTL